MNQQFIIKNKANLIVFLREWKESVETQALNMKRSEERDIRLDLAQEIQNKIDSLEGNKPEKIPTSMI